MNHSSSVWRGIHAIACAGLLLRLASAVLSERINWPDEIFQYLEQAHRLVYHYGIVPWEYRYGVRNWMLPGALAGVLEVLRAVGADTPARYIPAMKAVFCVLSISLVYSTYVVARHWYSERVARIAAVLVAFWYEMVYIASLGTPEVLATYLLIGALALSMQTMSLRRAALVGLLVGLAVALRLQYAPCAAVLLAWLAWRHRFRTWAVLGAFTAVPMLAAGALDAWTWGVPFSSFILGSKYNTLYNVADIFGVRSPAYYPWALLIASMGLYWVAGIAALIGWRKNLLAFALLASVLIPHTLLGHKEYRFITFALPLLLMLLAYATSLERLPAGWRPLLRGRPWLSRSSTGPGMREIASLRMGAAAAMLLISIVAGLGFAYRLPRQTTAYPNGPFDRDPILLAQLDLSRRDDVRAVAILFGDWVDTGGYYYMHRDVPLYWRALLQAQGASPAAVLSHALIREGDPVPEGFAILARYGNVAVVGRTQQEPALVQLPVDTRRPRNEEVERLIAPEVNPRL